MKLKTTELSASEATLFFAVSPNAVVSTMSKVVFNDTLEIELDKSTDAIETKAFVRTSLGIFL
jgi:hypothetical protein